MSPVDTDVERRVRAGLRAWQDEIAPAPTDFTAQLRARRRRRQRTRRSVGAALVAAASVIVTAGVVARGVSSSDVLRKGIEVEGLTVTLVQAGGVRDTANRFSVLVVGTARDGDTAAVLEVYESIHPIWATDAERGSGSWGGRPASTPTRRDAPPPLERVLAVPMDEFLSVSAPVETGTVEVLDEGGDVLVTLPLHRDGVSSAVPDGAAAVRVLDPTGDLVAEQPLTEVLE